MHTNICAANADGIAAIIYRLAPFESDIIGLLCPLLPQFQLLGSRSVHNVSQVLSFHAILHHLDLIVTLVGIPVTKSF